MKTYALFNNAFFQRKPWWMPQKLYDVVCQRSNPRTKDYMLHLLYEKFPDAELISECLSLPSSRVILVYSDSIGLGWGKLEKKCLKQFTEVQVLTGRKRIFDLTLLERCKLMFRRFFEITFFFELIIMPFLLIYGSILAIKDKIIGHVS